MHGAEHCCVQHSSYIAVGADAEVDGNPMAAKEDSYEPAPDGKHFFKKFANGDYCQNVYVQAADGSYEVDTASAADADAVGEYDPGGDGQHFFKKLPDGTYCQKLYIKTADGLFHAVESHA